MERHRSVLLWWVALCACAVTSRGQCPWPQVLRDLHESCVCVRRKNGRLAVQCEDVNFSRLMEALRVSAEGQVLGLLYVSNSSIPSLTANVFSKVSIKNIQLSDCGIEEIADRAFSGLESRLVKLNLSGNQLKEIPIEALRLLRSLVLLDVSDNKITYVPDGAFASLPLQTLKLADNNLTVSAAAFSGLERTLKNLYMKNTGLRNVPPAVTSLSSLAFLDLSQNSIARLRPGSFSGLDSLTALNLERNLLQSLSPDTFLHVSDTLNSLSLLNNAMAEFPTEALDMVSGLKVLDVGFNLFTELPPGSLRRLSSLTLLAVDGNPLSTLDEETFSHLRGNLRGLSLGGRFLECDCRVRWVTEWLRDAQLQVTSRERNPQFCGGPPELRDRSLQHLNPEELQCVETTTEAQTVPPTSLFRRGPGRPAVASRGGNNRVVVRQNPILGSRVVSVPLPVPKQPATTELEEPKTKGSPEPKKSVTKDSSELEEAVTRRTTDADEGVRRFVLDKIPEDNAASEASTLDPVTSTERQRQSISLFIPQTAPESTTQHQVPNLVFSPEQAENTTRRRPPNLVFKPLPAVPAVDRVAIAARSGAVPENQVLVKQVKRGGNSLAIKWDSEDPGVLGFRVVYRLFGAESFKQGPPLAPSEREFLINNVPPDSCVVVCVVSLDALDVSPQTVPPGQCREIRTEPVATSDLDTLVISVSAAICGTIVLALVVFLCCGRRARAAAPAAGTGVGSVGVRKELLPTLTSSTTAPQTSLDSLNSCDKPWGQVSLYSSRRSIPRPRLYQPQDDSDSIPPDSLAPDARSRSSWASSPHRSVSGGPDSLKSFSRASGRYPAALISGRNMALPRPVLHLSSVSLASAVGRGASPNLSGQRRHAARRNRADQAHAQSARYDQAQPNRLSQAQQTPMFETDDWMDHDTDIYVTSSRRLPRDPEIYMESTSKYDSWATTCPLDPELVRL